MAKNNKKIAAQLQALASATSTMEDADLLPMLLDSCVGLMKMVESRQPQVQQMDAADLAGYTARYTAISQLVGHFAQAIAPAEEAPNKNTQLTDMMANIDQKKAELEKLKVDIATQTATNDRLEVDVNSRKAELDKLKTFYDSLDQMSQNCSQDVIDQQTQANKDLFKEVTERTQKWEDLTREKEKLDAELQEIQQKISETTLKIINIPLHKAQLVADYDKKSAELTRLENAEVECSVENQQKLADKIALLEPIVTDLQEKFNRLEGQYEKLISVKTRLDRDEQILETNLLDLLNDAMGELTLLMQEHRDTLESVRKQADTFRDSLAECQRLRTEYDQWFGSNRKQRDSNLAEIDRQESTNLKETLNVQNQKILKEAFQQVEKALQESDRILHLCSTAAANDLRAIQNKAGV